MLRLLQSKQLHIVYMCMHLEKSDEVIVIARVIVINTFLKFLFLYNSLITYIIALHHLCLFSNIFVIIADHY